MKVLTVWLVLCIVWGTTWIFIKIGLTDLPPVTFAASRFTVSCFLLFPVLVWQGFEFPRAKSFWTMIILTGILQFFVNYGLLFWGEQYITSGLAAVLQATIPGFGLVLARIFIGEEITGIKVVSILLGMIGLGVIFYEQLSLNGTLALIGSLAVVIGAFAASLASVLTKARLQGLNPANVIFWQMFVGQIPLWIIGISVEGDPSKLIWSRQAIICVLYLAIIGSIAAFWLYYWLLGKIDVTRAMMIAFVTPVVAVFLGSFFGERLYPQTLFGGILILASVALVVLKRRNSEHFRAKR